MIQTVVFAILDWIQTNLKCPFLDTGMPKVTLLSEYGILLILIGMILLLRRSHRICGIAMLSGMAGGLLICNLILKNWFARPRPCWLNQGVDLLISVPKDYSFPSGHTLHCFIASTVLMYYDKRLGVPAAVMAVLVAFSRLYLFVHFPSDVVAGAFIGMGIWLVSASAFARIHLRKSTERPAEKNSGEG